MKIGSESSDGEELSTEIENQEKKSEPSDEHENKSHSEESDERKSESSQGSGENKSSSEKSEEKKSNSPKEEEEEERKSESEEEIKRKSSLSSSSSTSSKRKSSEPEPEPTATSVVSSSSRSKNDSKKSLSNDNTTVSTTTRTRTTTSNSNNSENTENSGNSGGSRSIEETITIDSTSTVSSNRVNGVLTIDELIKKYHIRAGRLTITLIKAINLYSSNRLISPYVQISIGHNNNKIIKESSIFQHTTVTPEFNKEILTFDIKNPRNFINNNDINMHIQIIDSETDELLGECRLSILDIISNTQNINIKTCDLFHYNDSGEKKKDGKVRFEPLFTPLRKGYIEVELKRYKNLRLLDVTKKSNICVEFKVFYIIITLYYLLFIYYY